MEFYIVFAAMICFMGYCIHAVNKSHEQTIAFGETVIRILTTLTQEAEDDNKAPPSPEKET